MSITETRFTPPAPAAEPAPVFKPFYGTSLVNPGTAEEHAAVRWAWLSPHLPPLEARRVLDVGCAEGLLTQRMAQHGPRLVVGVEKRADRVHWANGLPEVSEGRLRFFHGKAHQLAALAMIHPEAFAGGFDLVTCIGVLQHIPHTEKAAALRGLCGQAKELLLVEAPYARNPWHYFGRRRPTFRSVAQIIEGEGFRLVSRSGNVGIWRRME